MPLSKVDYVKTLMPYLGAIARIEDAYGTKADFIMDLNMLVNCSFEDEVVRPYLKPLSATRFGVMAKALHNAWEETKHLPYDEEQVVRKWAYACDVLRWQGYDCDGLLNNGMAILHPDCSIDDIL